jgi:hypothetical protein
MLNKENQTEINQDYETINLSDTNKTNKKKKEKVVIDFKNTPRSEVDPDLLTIPQRCEYFNPNLPQSRFYHRYKSSIL